MSRIRSQLDQMLASERSDAPPADSKSEFMQRLDSRLRELQGKAGSGAPRDSTQGERVPELDRIREKLNALADKIGHVREQESRPTPRRERETEHSGHSPLRHAPTHGAQSAARRLQPRDAHPLHSEDDGAKSAGFAVEIDQMASQLREMRQMMQEMHEMAGNRAVGEDYSSITRSIEAGYHEIASMLENRAAEVSRARATGNQQMSEISEQLETLAAAVGALPGRHALDSLETRIQEIGQNLSELGHSTPVIDQSQFSSIEGRLEELTQAVVSIGVDPSAGSDALDRVEARLDGLANTVEQLVESERRREAEGLYPPQWDEIVQMPEALRQGLAEIDSRLSQIGSQANESSPMIGPLTSQITDISDKLDMLLTSESGNAAGGDYAARLEEIAGQIETQLSSITQRLDRQEQGGGAELDPEHREDVLKLLHGLVVKVDEMDERVRASANGGVESPELHSRLGEVVERLDAVSGTGADLSPLTERLAAIENQLALSRDVAIDVAKEAAEQAVQMAGSGGGEVFATDAFRAPIEELREELQKLEQQTRERSIRHVQGFEALQQTLIAIADRLDQIDSSDHSAHSAETARQDEFGYENRPADQEHYSGPEYAEQSPIGDYEPGEALLTRAEEEFREGGDTDQSGRIGQISEEEPANDVFQADSEERALFGATEESPADTAEREPEAADAGKQIEEEIEDVPLEPGSDVPDLAALVRHASERRNAEKSAGEPSGEKATDFLAAARRAAQAAAESGSGSHFREEEGQESGKSRLAALAALVRGNRRALVLATAIILTSAIAAPFILGTSNDGQQISAVAPQEGEEVATAARGPAESGNRPELADNGENDDASESMMGEVETESGMADEPSQMADAREPDAFSEESRLSDEPASGNGMQPPETAGETMSSTLINGDGGAEMQEETDQDPRLSTDARNITVAPMPPPEAGNTTLRQAAASGDGRALFEIARRFTDGIGVERDLAEAIEWYRLAAERGFPPAQYRLGNFLEKGHGGSIDLEGAARWYERAAENGNALAMHNLAVLHTSGLIDGKPQMEPAVKWFRRAADLGVKDSQVNLGIIYAKGLGVAEDLAESYKWFAIAARGGDSDAAQKRDTVASAMRPDQLETARGKAELWQAEQIDRSANVVEIPDAWKSDSGREAEMTRRQLIARAQALLAEKGYDPGPADGLMGDRTRSAVMEFQKSMGIPANGEITRQLLETLENDSA